MLKIRHVVKYISFHILKDKFLKNDRFFIMFKMVVYFNWITVWVILGVSTLIFITING